MPDIAVDFDGTICKFAYPNIGPPEPDVKEALTLLRKAGYRLIIHSCRTSRWYPEIFNPTGLDESTPEKVMQKPKVVAMKKFLDAHQIPYDVIDAGFDGKPMADYYIDDKGLRYDGNWMRLVKFIFGGTS